MIYPLCADAKSGKYTPLTDKSVGESEQDNLPVNALVGFIGVL